MKNGKLIDSAAMFFKVFGMAIGILAGGYIFIFLLLGLAGR
jgi:hypothetical protein